ncbi:Phosphatase NudJ [Sinobacterium norvegicum]|uniref:Phosphatase NudJ n=1 Tax=Sinobacterium norvegicum TaxID=1641715 RepID=A0ABN8ECY3_9GAMM|nr:NUDIX hydrolase [Sinobacterium norvegicum]CAH0990329.1 Phosphatase NudJ [Sinobacterium norvegicum]
MIQFTPHVTVATVVVRQKNDLKEFLLVEERCKTTGVMVLNQPAGHVEEGEELADAARRETREETAHHVKLTGLLGSARYVGGNGITYFRTTFLAEVENHDKTLHLDTDITAIHWLNFDQITALSARMRSPLVISSIERYLNGHCYPLSFIYS